MVFLVALSLNYPRCNIYLAIGHGFYVVEIHIKSALHDNPISQVLGNTRSNVRAVLVNREQEVFTHIHDDFVLHVNDTLLLCGTRTELKNIAPRLV